MDIYLLSGVDMYLLSGVDNIHWIYIYHQHRIRSTEDILRWIYLGLDECIEITEALGWLQCWQQEVFTFTMGDRYMQLVFTVMGSIVSCSWDGALICLASSALCVPHSVSPGKVLICHCCREELCHGDLLLDTFRASRSKAVTESAVGTRGL